MKRALWAVIGVLVAAPAWGQSAYIAGAIGAEIVRATSVKSSGSNFEGGNGESWSGAIRVGTVVTPRLGVELEFLRPGTIEGGENGPVYLAADIQRAVLESLVVSRLVGDAAIFPIISQETRMRTSTLSALAFVRQAPGKRVEIAYLAGLGFSRVVREIEFGIPRGFLAAGRPFIPSYKTRTTQYGVGPVVGAEGRIGMTEHVRLVAGVRLHALGQSLVDGWLVRPSLGLAWTF
jgi:hypothetical protein